MSTLPAINKINYQTSASSKSKSNRKNIKFMTWRELELVKQQNIREENPTVSRVDTSTFRNSYLHNLCVSMLKSGFHKSFDELFTLIETRKNERLKAGIGSTLWQEPSLGEQEEKLDELWRFLTKAETASRQDKWDEVHEARTHLAEFFLQTGDVWLSDYFFKSALDTSLDVRLDGRRREAEANCRMGLAYERKGDYQKATQHMEEFYKLSANRSWLNESGVTHMLSACRHLSRLYSSLAERCPDPNAASPLLHQSLNMAKEGEDPNQVAEAALNLGRNYELNKDSESAIQYLIECLETAQTIRHEETIGHACEALAHSYLTQGNLPRALEFLDLYAKTSQSNDLSLEFIEACSGMGKIYNSTGAYDKAVESFGAAYDQSCAIMHDDQLSKVHLGIALGHTILNDFKQNTDHPLPVMMSRIVTWKDERSNKFGDALPTSPVEPSPTPQLTPDPTKPFREANS